VGIFCADNGTSGYAKNNRERQEGTHIPLIIYAPGTQPAEATKKRK
jgi:arylsulfatase A-like enzyme